MPRRGSKVNVILLQALTATALVAANALCAAPVRRLPVPGTGAAGFGRGEPRATVVPKTRSAGSVLLSAFHAVMLIELFMVREKAHTREGDAIAAARPAAADGGGGLHHYADRPGKDVGSPQ
jgi:hypothetical protein